MSLEESFRGTSAVVGKDLRKPVRKMQDFVNYQTILLLQSGYAEFIEQFAACCFISERPSNLSTWWEMPRIWEPGLSGNVSSTCPLVNVGV